MIRFTGYGVIAQKLRVSYHEIFPCTLYENLCVGSKNDCHLLECSRRPLQRTMFGGDRRTRAGCRCENMVFAC